MGQGNASGASRHARGGAPGGLWTGSPDSEAASSNHPRAFAGAGVGTPALGCGLGV